MPSRVTILPASTQVGHQTILALLSSPQQPLVRGIYRDPSKAPASFASHPNFEAVKGDVAADAPLDFAGSEAVLYIPPPTWDGTDTAEFATRTATRVKEAVQSAGVKRLVVQSALGAQRDAEKLVSSC